MTMMWWAFIAIVIVVLWVGYLAVWPPDWAPLEWRRLTRRLRHRVRHRYYHGL